MKTRLTRRNFLGATTAAAASLTLGKISVGAAAGEPSAAAGFRFVHLTDIHIAPENHAPEGLQACLAAIDRLDPKPDFILTGGDNIMDALDQTHERAKSLYELFNKIMADHAGLPVKICMGNHEVFGWSNKKGVKPSDPLYGKKMFCERHGLPGTYYRFDHKGWRFFVLDDVQPAVDPATHEPPFGYVSYIDEAQMDWLEGELREKPAAMPAAVVCHIPIFSMTVFEDAKDHDARNVPHALMCRDARALAELFNRHNVRLALSGHQHQVDTVKFRDVTFVCDGAVSGGWWGGPFRGFEEGFGILDLDPGGTLRHQYCDYGWRAKK